MGQSLDKVEQKNHHKSRSASASSSGELGCSLERRVPIRLLERAAIDEVAPIDGDIDLHSAPNDDIHSSDIKKLANLDISSSSIRQNYLLELALMESQMSNKASSSPSECLAAPLDPFNFSVTQLASTKGEESSAIEKSSFSSETKFEEQHQHQQQSASVISEPDQIKGSLSISSEEKEQLDNNKDLLKEDYLQTGSEGSKDKGEDENKMSFEQKETSTFVEQQQVESPLTSGVNRATTTERRTTTTTTTKRTIKSSDDFVPSATDIQQVRSESRTSSISSSSPLFGATSGGGQPAPASSNVATSNNNNSSSSTNNSSQQQQQNSSTTTTTTSSTTKQPILSSSTSSQQTSSTRNWQAAAGADSGFQSPFIQDTEEGRLLKLRFDVTQYEPEEIVVKTVDQRLTVQAKHEEKSENRSVYREYNREFHLPDGTDVEQIRSSLSKDGVLTVECPLPTQQAHGFSRQIPIERA